MKRFVSYLYLTHNNKKIHNSGFARVEMRDGRNRIEVHLRENGYSGKTGNVHLFFRENEKLLGIMIGSLSFRNNQADFRYEQPGEKIAGTDLPIDEMNGIAILIEDQIGFISQWDEQPLDMSGFQIWEPEKKSEKDTKMPEKEKAYEETHFQKQEASGHITPAVQNIREDSSTPEINLKKQNEEKQKNEINKGVHENKSANIKPSKRQKSNMPGPTAYNLQQNAERSKQQMSATEKAMLNTAPAVAITNAPEKIISEQDIKKEEEKNVRTTELTGQEPAGNLTWEQQWRLMLRSFPVMNQLSGDRDVLCIRIELKDMRLLPEKYWSTIHNSFLLHGFFNYHYLVFGRMEDKWFIGVPGVYQNQEHAMASMFGFPEFLSQDQLPKKSGTPGCWYRILE